MQISPKGKQMRPVASLQDRVMVIEGFTAEMGEDLAIIFQTYLNTVADNPSNEGLERRRKLAKDLADYLFYDEQLAEQRLAEERSGRKVRR